MKKLFTFCVVAFNGILQHQLKIDSVSKGGDMVAGITYNSAYDNKESITDDLAFTVGYAVSDEFTIMVQEMKTLTGAMMLKLLRLILVYVTSTTVSTVRLT